MTCPAVVRLAAICALALCLAAARSQTRSIQGMVTTSDGLPVGRVSVSIDGRVIDTTGDSGGFHTPLQPPLRVGFPVVFTVTGWLVVDPCSGDRGREYLPDPDAEAIHLKVLQPGDHRLVEGTALNCLLLVRASHLPPPKKPIPGVPGASLLTANPAVLASLSGPGLPAFPAQPRDPAPPSLRLTLAAWHPPHPARAMQSPAGSSGVPSQDDAGFLAEQAKELGLPAADINDAISRLSKTSDDPWQKGLAAIYEGRFPEAVELIRKSIDVAPAEIDRYVPLAYAEYMQGHYAATEAALRKVISVHPDDPVLLSNLGIVLSAEGKNDEAETDLKQAISLGEARADVTAVAQSRNGLSYLYFQEGKFPLAEEQLQKALDIDKRADDPVAYGSDYQGLAIVYAAEGRYAESGTMAANALNADQAVLGADNPALVVDLLYQAVAASGQGKPADAEPIYKHALKILQDSGHGEDPYAAAMMAALGYLHSQQYNFDDALKEFTDALRIMDKAQKSLADPLGPDAQGLHFIRADILNGLGSAYYRGEYNLPAAESAYREALSLFDTSSPIQAPLVAVASQSLAEVYLAENQTAQAESMYRQALQILNQREPDSPQRVLVMTDLASLEYASPDKAKVADAETLLSRSLAIKEKQFGENSPALRLEKGMLARIYCSSGRCPQAEPIIRGALADDEAKFGQNNSLYASDLGELGYLYLHCGDPQKAEPLYQQAIALQEKVEGPGFASTDARLIEFYNNLAASIRSQGGREAEAAKYEQHAKEIDARRHAALTSQSTPQP